MNDPVSETAAPAPSSGGIGVYDVLQILFRRRWLILVFTVLGLAAAATLYVLDKPVFVSTAKIIVRYIVFSTSTEIMGQGDTIRSPDSRGESILSAEAEILKSWDLAEGVARAIMATNTASSAIRTTNHLQLASRILGGLEVEVPRKSTVMSVSYRHRDRESVQPILSQIVDRYRERHQQMHSSRGAVDGLFRRAQGLKTALDDIESQLRAAKSNANVYDFAEARRQLNEQTSRTEEGILETETLLKEQQARMRQFQSDRPPVATNTTTELPALSGVDPRTREAYRTAIANLLALQGEEQRLLASYGPEFVLVQNIRKRLAEARSQAETFEKDHPALIGTATSVEGVPAPTTDLAAENAKLVSLQSRLESLKEQRERLLQRASGLDAAGPEILKLEAQRLEATDDWKKALERYDLARLEAERDPSQQSSIQVVQHPSLPAVDSAAKLKKAGAAAGGGLALGLALAFLLDLFVDQRVRTASEVEKRLNLPLMLSIPALEGIDTFTLDVEEEEGDVPASPRKADGSGPVPILPSLMADAPHLNPPEPAAAERVPNGERAATLPALRAPWDMRHAMRPYFEALRDRMTLFFQLRALKHKPKLVAVAACSDGAGTSTIAAGLAAAMSETGDGNVLLVDMNLGKGAVYPFFRGRPGIGLSEALDPNKRPQGQVQENLYLASVDAGGVEAQPRPLPKRLFSLLPKIRASDFDYIIFDMPPISQTSATVALAANMDTVLLVVEGNRTTRPDLRRAHDLLKKYNTNVLGVFNKERSTAPQWLLPQS